VSIVKVGETESVDSAIKRFKRKCQKDGIIGDLRKKMEYEKPSVHKKKKSEEARKNSRKKKFY
jgi:small subunit ribosomal protein S21